MAILFEYRGPLDIGSAFRSKSDVGEFVEFMIGQVNEMTIESSAVDFIPPAVYFQPRVESLTLTTIL